MLVDIEVLFQSSVFQSACSYIMRNSYTKNSNIAPEATVPCTTIKELYLNKVTGNIAIVIFLFFSVVIRV